MSSFSPFSWRSSRTSFKIPFQILFEFISKLEWVLYYGIATYVSCISFDSPLGSLSFPIFIVLAFHSILTRHWPSIVIAGVMGYWYEWMTGLPMGMHLIVGLIIAVITSEKTQILSRPFWVRLVTLLFILLMYQITIITLSPLQSLSWTLPIIVVLTALCYPALCLFNPLKTTLFQTNREL